MAYNKTCFYFLHNSYIHKRGSDECELLGLQLVSYNNKGESEFIFNQLGQLWPDDKNLFYWIDENISHASKIILTRMCPTSSQSGQNKCPLAVNFSGKILVCYFDCDKLDVNTICQKPISQIPLPPMPRLPPKPFIPSLTSELSTTTGPSTTPEPIVSEENFTLESSTKPTVTTITSQKRSIQTVTESPQLFDEKYECDYGSLVGDRCYLLTSVKYEGKEMRQACTYSYSGKPAAVISNEVQNSLHEMVRKAQQPGLIGAEAKNDKGYNYMWITGDRFSFNRWELGQPSPNAQGGDRWDCVLMNYMSGKWHSIDCSRKERVFCE